MLKSHEAIYENGQVKWLTEKQQISSARIIVTVLEETPNNNKPKRTTPAHLVGKAEILGDIVSPILEAEDTVTTSEETTPQRNRRFPVAAMAGKVTILGDIVSPIVDEEDWE
jgi:hypothetical protein